MDEPAWQKADKIEFYHLNKEHAKQTYEKPFYPTTGRILWDKNNIYIGMEAEDADIWSTIEKHGGALWTEDVLEIFFKPRKDRHHLYEFEISPKNFILEIFYPSRGLESLWKSLPPYKSGLTSATKIYGTLNNWKDKDHKWTAEVAIPFSAFNETLKTIPDANDEWHFTLCRYDYSAYLEDVELSSSAMLSTDAFSHYEDYDVLHFQK